MEIRRDILETLKLELKQQKVLVLLGARQVGKTYLMQELEEYVLKEDHKTKYFNLELPEDSRFFAKDELDLYKEITQDLDYLFIDEFQYFKNASKFFKAIYDDRKLKIKIIASGSSALEMHKHLQESLAGRKNTFIIRPLSFREFSQSKMSFEIYLRFGGNPELVSILAIDKKISYLKEMNATYIMKDIKSLIKEENITAFNDMLYYLAQNQGQLISVNSLSGELKLNNSTVENYLEILSQTYVLHKIQSYSKNLSNENKKSKKFYFYDSGIRNAILNNFSESQSRNDKGSIYESYVCNFLIKNSPANAELRFWRTRNGEEIDFVFLKDQKPFLFEVKSKLTNLEIPGAIKTFVRNYPQTQAVYIVNENQEEELELYDTKIRFIKISNLEKDLELKEIFTND